MAHSCDGQEGCMAWLTPVMGRRDGMAHLHVMFGGGMCRLLGSMVNVCLYCFTCLEADGGMRDDGSVLGSIYSGLSDS